MIAQSTMDIARPTPLLGGLSPEVFMRRHWQRKPLLVRQAVPGGAALLSRRALFDLAASDAVEARLVTRSADGRWALRDGPFRRAALPPLRQRGWSLLVQGLDLHVAAAHELLARFRFVPDARLDDLMLSYATDGGGVGPHVDSYDVFLLQTSGRRRWRVGRCSTDAALVDGVPLKLLAGFRPTDDWLLEPGDLLYLPPGWGHDGVAEGECTTASIGFRAPARDELGRDLLQRLADAVEPGERDSHFRDRGQPATAEPGRIPASMQEFAAEAIARRLADPVAVARALGERLSEPEPRVWFDPALPAGATAATDGIRAGAAGVAIRLDRRSRLLYDDRFVYINGESYRAAGRDRTLLRRLADRRRLGHVDVAAFSVDARGLLADWVAAGWLQVETDAGTTDADIGTETAAKEARHDDA